MSDSDEDDETVRIKRLKTAIHYAVGTTCDSVANENNVKFTKQFVGTLSELTYKQIGLMADSLEAFAGHAKRSTIKPDDVKLIVRKSEQLHKYISRKADKLATDKGGKRRTKPPAKK